MGDPFAALAEWVTEVVESGGYPGVFFLIALEELFPPIPSELILPLAGFLAGHGRFEFIGVLVAATAGSTTGALVLYGGARTLGEARVRQVVERHGRFVLLRGEDVDRAHGWFDRHGQMAVVLGRCVPVVRSLVAIPAGLEPMPVARFVASTVAGSLIWNGFLIGLGWWLGDRWTVVQDYGRYLEIAALAAVALTVGRWIRKRKGRS